MEFNIGLALEHLYPNATPLVDWEVSQGENGPYISQWNLSSPEPTQEELQAVWLEVLKTFKKDEMKRNLLYTAIQLADDPDVRSVDDLILLVIPTMFAQLTASSRAGSRAAEQIQRNIPPQTDLVGMMSSFAKFYGLKASIEDAATEEELKNITWQP